jgi:hypothetical protein
VRRAWLMDLYFFPPVGTRRELGDALTPHRIGTQT